MTNTTTAMNVKDATDAKGGWWLLTGGNGFLGAGLIASLDAETRARCVCVVRKRTPEFAATVGAVIEGAFNDEDTLRALADYRITAVVHLAAVTGGCSEADGMAVNVEGTRVLMRSLVAQGCRRFVLASSVAATGLQRTDFCPVELPMTEEHPCLDKDGYGFSKYLMEEVARYQQRQEPAVTVVCLRFGAICPDDAAASPFVPETAPPAWTYAHFSRVYRRDAVRAIRLALNKPSAGGFLAVNVVARQSALAGTVRELVERWHPEWTGDLTAYDRAGHERDAVFCTKRAEAELGFVAEWPE